MSSFSGLSTAMSSLIAQRQALEVTGQNIANANTVGYTRQRADMQSVSAAGVPSLFSRPSGVGNGVSVVDVARLSDQFLDSRLRTQTSLAAHTTTLATNFARIESVLNEPSDTGVSSGLEQFWNAWQTVSDSPDNSATRTALIGTANGLVAQIADTYRGLESQWDQARAETDSLVSQVNATASSIATLNQTIRGVAASGGSTNELDDQRDQLVLQLSELVGATAQTKPDGTMTVMVGGNPLVQGDRANTIEALGSHTMATEDPVTLQWADGTALPLKGGILAGALTAVQPYSHGGSIAAAVNTINEVASLVEERVNDLHTTGHTLDGNPAGEFFTFVAGAPPALGLAVAVTNPSDVAAGFGAQGAFDGSLADAISQLRHDAQGPDNLWRSYVVDLGVTTSAHNRRAEVAFSALGTAQTLHMSNASVDIDEEMTNMLMYQRAYQGASRVLTTIDEMLDQLINRTGIVGR